MQGQPAVGRRTVVSFRCTPAEAHLIHAAAADKGETASDLIRSMVLGEVQRRVVGILPEGLDQEGGEPPKD